MKHVASLSKFVPNTSWSVYNARRNKADIALYFSSILPILRQNVADFGTKHHCIETVNSATTLLNPGQTVVDTSDQNKCTHFQRDCNKCIQISLDKGSTVLCLVDFI